ncbi:type II secretory pathway predicted ATPase ExeA [Geothermobacter ehrlichii]|uniref:Type II secretory pathway predicted ATPase ExeA n=1 Tax=Geothermobacter ehrlichii TaxID=213224 RepID=A0A5D3WNG6_9BACT|nr:AAA family ATPase [Geothermobacter ehrlichii]TYP00098.1 type II secretory pathway predicted ATPase ExeA [Geothermobacter ehrlichii]
MSYLEHFGLEREPFSNAPDAKFYFNSEQHSQALLRLMYAVDSNKGLAVLVGGVGTGKTTLARRMLENLPEDRYESSLLVMVHSGITQEWILTRIAMQLGVQNPADDRLSLLKQLYERLLDIEAGGRKAVVLIDEAQMLESRELMEEFRGLLNLEIPGKKLLNIIFFGLPEVEDCLRLDEPLAQRVAVKYHLKSMTVETTAAYIKHRLHVAKAPRMLFDEEIIPEIYRYAGGVPRLINTICDNCLFEAFMRKLPRVNGQVLQSVVGDLGLLQQSLIQASAQTVDDDLDEIESMLDRLEQK